MSGACFCEDLQCTASDINCRIFFSFLQVVRFDRDGVPFWTTPTHIIPPPCGRCGGKRTFKYQVCYCLFSFSKAIYEVISHFGHWKHCHTNANMVAELKLAVWIALCSAFRILGCGVFKVPHSSRSALFQAYRRAKALHWLTSRRKGLVLKNTHLQQV